jgi:D-aminopeptidase
MSAQRYFDGNMANAAVAGHYGVPVIMVSGDQTACTQVEVLGEMEHAGEICNQSLWRNV